MVHDTVAVSHRNDFMSNLRCLLSWYPCWFTQFSAFFTLFCAWFSSRLEVIHPFSPPWALLSHLVTCRHCSTLVSLQVRAPSCHITIQTLSAYLHNRATFPYGFCFICWRSNLKHELTIGTLNGCNPSNHFTVIIYSTKCLTHSSTSCHQS